MDRIEQFRGERTGLMVPAHPQAFAEAGTEFLTAAFRAFGAIGADDAVAGVAKVAHCPGGSTGAKLFMDVSLASAPAVRHRLFVKFSRDFDDPRRDWQRWEMGGEVAFQWVARAASFPIAVARPWFADWDGATGTGLVITDRVAFGEGAIEPHRRKTMDRETLADPIGHYRATVTALARLAAAHKSGALGPDIDTQFPFDPVAASADPIAYDRAALIAELQRCFDFAARAPQLLPEHVRTPEFHARMERDVWRVFEHEAELQRFLLGDPRMIALNHWNSHIDNCWFERRADGELVCGLIDWGRVGQISFGSALWGGLSAAHYSVWDDHFDDLLALFVREYHAHGGPLVSVDELMLHLTVHIATMGVSRVLAFPEIIEFRLPECVDANGPADPMFEPVEVDGARNCLHVYTVFLKLWHRRDLGKALDRVLGPG
jgi:hypothetical protein